jgi:hypothetical protein
MIRVPLNLEIVMKTTLFASLLLCGTAAFGQAAGNAFSSEPQPIQMQSHQQHASQQFMQADQSLLFTSNGNSSDRGERPLWEVGAKPPAEIPLGDVARSLRNQHANARKAIKVLEK